MRRFLAMAGSGLLVALAVALVSAQTQQTGVLAMHIGKGCQVPHARRFELYVDGNRVDGPGSFSFHKTGPMAALEKHTYRFTVSAGFYHYDASITPMDVAELGCSMNDYVAVMPADVRIHEVPLWTGTGDPLTPMLLAGTKPPRFQVSLERAGDRIDCNSKVGPQQRKPIATENDSRAYYIATENDSRAYYSEAAVDDDEQNMVPFILQIERSPGEVRMLRIELQRPKESISGEPTFLRLDLTPALLRRIFQSPGDTVSCL